MTSGFNRQALAVVFCAVAGAATAACADDFRIENEVFLGNEKEPRAESTTIFQDGVVYDYLKQPPEVTVFDKTHGRFILLDTVRRVKTELTAGEVEDFIRRLKQRASQQKDPFIQFMANPSLQQRFDEGSGELVFDSDWINYRLLTTGAKSQAMSRQYRDFCDGYCLLNTMLNPGARPPFARLQINEALERREMLPREVHLTLRPKRGFRPRRINIRSEHRLRSRLVESDRRRVAQTKEFIAIYQSLSFEEFLKPDHG